MKQKNILILTGIALVLTMSLSVFFLVKDLKKKDVEIDNNEVTGSQTIDEEVNNVIENTEDIPLTEEELEEMSQEDKNNFILGESIGQSENAIKLGNKNSPEYGKEMSNSLYQQLLQLAQSASYIDIVNRVDEVSKKYKLTEDYNWKIGDIYLDATVMISAKDSEKGQMGYMVSNLKDPYMLLIGTLMLPERERREVIKETGSLSPIFEGVVSVGETTIITHEDKESDINASLIFKSESSVKELYKIKFQLEGNPLVAYIIRYNNGRIAFKTINLDGDYPNGYKTISYWMNLDKVIYGDEN